MSFSQRIAWLVTERRRVVWSLIALVTLGCTAILITRVRVDTEVLNLLPRGFESVEGLKIYNRDFAQTRELIFALLCQPDDVQLLDEFAPVFTERLREQPWSERVLAGSPMETPEGMKDLQKIAVPLLLNLEPQAFTEAVGVLSPDRVRERLTRLREQLEAGSLRSQFELELDPLGVVTPALKPFASTSAMTQDQPLVSPDGTMRVFVVVTNEEDTGAWASQRLMDQVKPFLARAKEGWEGGPLEVFVTGRAAYVAEISRSMRHDIVLTLLGSVLLVSAVFYLGFHRWLPLLGMGIALFLSCLVSLALGVVIFGHLNMVTVGFCAILIGLGVDFAILVYGRYQQGRDEGLNRQKAVAESAAGLSRAIFYGALTTAAGFLALLLAGSPGFTQLGVLIAIGISFAGIFTLTVFFMFLPERTRPAENDWLLRSVKAYVAFAVDHPKRVLAWAVPLLALLTVIAVSPWPRLAIDISTRSMEPKRSEAGHALGTIMAKMPMRWEPVLGIVRAETQEKLHAHWQKLQAKWQQLRDAGRIKDFSTPAALIISPERTRINREQLHQVDLAASRQALQQAVAAEGFSAEAFASAFQLLDQLQSVAGGAPLPNWREQLPKSSSWWFLVDRYFADEPLLTTGFVTTNEPVNRRQQEILRREMPVEGVPLVLSGWSFTLADLLPWSKRQLILITALMAFFEAGLLALLYRDWRLWVIQVLSLMLAVAAMIASMKLLNIPLNILNVLAFRLVIAIGVDYGIYVLLVWQQARELEHDVAGIVKPVVMAGLTAVAGFASLGIANNPTLAGLGYACALGIFWSLATTIFFMLPAAAAAEPKLLDRKK